MPRQSRGRPAARSAPAPQQQSRGAHTQAAPPPTRAPAPGVPVQQTQQAGGGGGGGMFANMASTAAGVAVGSTMGHGLSSMLFGGGAAQQAPAAPVEQQSFEERKMGGSCEIQAKDFTQCLNATQGDLPSCQYYLEMLKSCQQAAAPY